MLQQDSDYKWLFKDTLLSFICQGRDKKNLFFAEWKMSSVHDFSDKKIIIKSIEKSMVGISVRYFIPLHAFDKSE